MSKFLQAIAVISLCNIFLYTAVLRSQTPPVVIRAGYFPNITQAQALLGEANGAFEKALGPKARSIGRF